MDIHRGFEEGIEYIFLNGGSQIHWDEHKKHSNRTK
jgi:hypothetical protein